MPFPPGFVWGAASSAYQIEGAAESRGHTIWDTFTAAPDRLRAPHHPARACDHVHRYAADVALMRDLGLRAYRFSVAWARVLPSGDGTPSPDGLAFYDRLADALLAAGITPYLTLFHWDYPHALFLRGGWLNRDSARWFADYAALVVDRLSDRVSHWITINEPQIFIGMGHRDGTNAPGLRLPARDWLLAAHHALMAHGLACQVIRARAKTTPTVGWAPIGRVRYPATDRPEDIAAARDATASVLAPDCWNNTWFADPVCLGRYPDDGLALFGADAPRPRSGDMNTIRQPLDFFGLNIYDGVPFRAGSDGRPEALDLPSGHPRTAFNWPVVPEALYWGPRFIFERYRVPVMITENGMSGLDWVADDGAVHDPQRIDFTRRYLKQLERAIADGTDVRGYFHWSIMDNFEWSHGYTQRFGLIHVDFETQRRTLKNSAHWYRTVIESNGASL